jgi:threonine/homoserine/homoserine lactone efflux protein
MQPSFFLRGIAVGFALAAPIGPVGVLCIRRALADGRHAAFIAGLGAAVADTFYGAVAGLGLTVVSSFLVSHQLALRLVGGLFLIVLGVRGLRASAIAETTPNQGPGLLRDVVSTFLITLTNPATIFAAFGVFAALGALTGPGESGPGTYYVLGVFGGSALWWLLLSAAAGAARARLSPRRLDLLMRGSGGFLLLCGLLVMACTLGQLV